MNVSLPSLSSMPIFNNSAMHNRRVERSKELAKKHYDKVEEYYDTKRSDFELRKVSFQDWEYKKITEEINSYLALKRSLEYGLYQYGRYLGYNLDVYI
jgi:hypothetical protein